MRFSVITPCHNNASYVAEALRSAAQQTLAPYEIIVINDDSTDDSVQRIKASGIDVHLIEGRYHNAAAARNAGIECAQGDWIAILDADDLWLPNHLQQAAELLSGCDDAAYTAEWLHLHDDTGQQYPLKPHWNLRPTTGLSPETFLDTYCRDLGFGHSAVIMRRDVVQAVGGYDPQLLRRHDIDLFLRVLHEHTWSYHPTPGAVYRVDTPGAISRKTANAELYLLRSLLKAQQRYDHPALSAAIRRTARHAMTLAYLEGDHEDQQRAWSLAPKHISTLERSLFRIGKVSPGLLRMIIQWRRRQLAGRGQKTRVAIDHS